MRIQDGAEVVWEGSFREYGELIDKLISGEWRIVKVPADVTLYRRCPKRCELGTLDLGTHAVHCDTCMGMGFVEVSTDDNERNNG